MQALRSPGCPLSDVQLAELQVLADSLDAAHAGDGDGLDALARLTTTAGRMIAQATGDPDGIWTQGPAAAITASLAERDEQLVSELADRLDRRDS